MRQSQKRAAPRQRATLPQITKSLTSFDTENTATSHLFQDLVDPVVILAARSGVAAATVRAQLAAWRIGGAHG